MAESSSPWRVIALTFIFVNITLLYGANAIFSNLELNEDFQYNYDMDINESSTVGSGNISQNYEYDTTQGQGFIDIILGALNSAGQFGTFSPVENIYARLILTSYVALLSMLAIYLIYTFARDWAPLV